jgi:PAS domain S-box-containing protein
MRGANVTMPRNGNGRRYREQTGKTSTLSRQQPALSLSLARAVIDMAPDGFLIIDHEQHITLANKQIEELFRYDKKEIIGQSYDILIPERFRTAHTTHITHYLQSPHTRSMGIGLELFARRKDGSEFPVEISLSPITIEGETHIITSVRDVTERHTLEKALRVSEREAALRAQEAESRLSLLQALINELPGSVFMVGGLDARLVLANRATHDMWGTTWKIGQPILEFLDEHQIRIFATDGRPLNHEEFVTLRVVRTGKSIKHYQEVIRYANGETLPILANAVAIECSTISLTDLDINQENKAGYGALVIMQDVTALKEAERLKDEFVGIAAHELRNPLSALKGYADMLIVQTQRGNGPDLAEWQDEAIQSIDQATSRLVALTDDLLDVTRLQSGKIEMHVEARDIVTHIRKIVNRMQMTNEHHVIIVESPTENILAYFDVLRMEQVIHNLLNNAIKYSPDKDMVGIRIIADNENDLVLISVTDQGIGIPAHQQARVFDRFSRADNAIGLGIPGTGLGLYLCRELLDRQGGRIWFDSEEGIGSTFYVALPLAREIPINDEVGIG